MMQCKYVKDLPEEVFDELIRELYPFYEKNNEWKFIYEYFAMANISRSEQFFVEEPGKHIIILTPVYSTNYKFTLITRYVYKNGDVAQHIDVNDVLVTKRNIKDSEKYLDSHYRLKNSVALGGRDKEVFKTPIMEEFVKNYLEMEEKLRKYEM